MSRVSAVKEWAGSWPGCKGLAKLNGAMTESGETTIAATAAEGVTRRFLDGTCERYMVFSMGLVLPWSDGHDAINAEAAELAEQWADWCAAQWPGNPPAIPGARVTGIEAVTKSPAVEAVDEAGSAATYTFEVRIDYMEV